MSRASSQILMLSVSRSSRMFPEELVWWSVRAQSSWGCLGVNSCCRATSQDPASLRLTLNSAPAARQGNNSRRCRDTDLQEHAAFHASLSESPWMAGMPGHVLLQPPPRGTVSGACVTSNLRPRFPAVFPENQYFMLSTAAFVKRERSLHGESSNMQHL